MRPTICYVLLLAMCLLAFPSNLLRAQNELAPFSSVIGNPAPGEVQEWTFTAVDGEVVSLIAEGAEGFDPVVTILSETGAVLLTNDDYDYPATVNAVLQAVTIPFTGTYTAQITGAANTSGSYTLTRLRGFADGFLLNGFVSGQEWTSENDGLEVTLTDGELALELTGNNETAFVLDEGGERLSDYYAQVDVEITEGTDGWVVHKTIRQQNANSYYLLSVADTGLWRFLLRQNGEETLIRDWVSHPAIVRGETEFQMGALANGSTIELFYNGSPLGYFVDSALDGGVLGFGVETAPALNADIGVAFRNLAVTVPLLTTAGNPPDVTQVILEDPLSMARSLEHQQAVPAGGNLVLNVPESSVQFSSAGISRIGLARGSTFRNFIMAADVNIASPGSVEAGCGIYLRSVDEENYLLAFLDQVGGYGLARRATEGFLPGVFGEDSSLAGGEHQLMVVMVEANAKLYIDGQYRGEVTTQLPEGSIGIAAVNFVQNVTTCNMRNVWVWAWE